MAYDEGLAERIREVFERRDDVREKKMFGGIAFMIDDHMCCGILGDALMLRVGKDNYEAMLAEPHAMEMDFTGRPMRGFLKIVAEGFVEDTQLSEWISRGESFVKTLPPK